MNRFAHFKKTGLPFVEIGVFFWLPSTIYHWIRADDFGAAVFDIPAVTIFPLLSLGSGFSWMWRSQEKPGNLAAACAYTLLGVWVFGPLFMTLGATASGGGFASPEGFLLAIGGTLIFPAVTFMMSAYDGTLGALALATLLLGGVASLGLVRFIITQLVRRRSGQ